MGSSIEHLELESVRNSWRVKRWRLENQTLVKAFAECLGTFFLIFIGCMTDVGSMTVNPPYERQTAFNFGLVVNTIVMMLGHISGAYLNPAMTLGAVILGYRSVFTGVILIIAELVGGILGFGVLVASTPENLWHTGYPKSRTGVCLTLVHPELLTLQGLTIEFLCTVVLMLVNCSVWDARNIRNSDSTSLRIGFAVSALSIAGVPYTGCSMNPARSFAPALWQNNWADHWIYWVGPCGGSVAGVLIYSLIFQEKSSEIEDTKRKKNPRNCTIAVGDTEAVVSNRS